MALRPPRPALALLALATLGLACAPHAALLEPDAPLERPVVERISAQQLRVRWPAAFAPDGVVRISSGTSPDAITREIGLAEGGEASLRRPGGGPLGLARPVYFELAPTDGAPSAIVAERRLPLEGADNFRDLGGYRAADGRAVRWGLLFRSNDLSGLTASDRDYLRRAGLRLVCDLRSARERSETPDRPVPGAQTVDLPIDLLGVEPDAMRERILNGAIAALPVELIMQRAYRSFVTEESETWAALLRRLARPESLPAVVHCTAGKDRTGFAAALVLLALGVPEETVFEDYLLSNRYRRDYHAFVLRWVPLASLFRTDPADLLPLLEARRSYLQASLDAMRELHGSVDGYLEQALGVDAELRSALRHRLLR
jgi:protein-tyrosine phosphatase